MPSLAASVSWSASTLVDIILADVSFAPPTAARPIWETWYAGLPTELNQWADLTSEQRVQLLNLAWSPQHAVVDDGGHRTHHMDGQRQRRRERAPAIRALHAHRGLLRGPGSVGLACALLATAPLNLILLRTLLRKHSRQTCSMMRRRKVRVRS